MLCGISLSGLDPFLARGGVGLYIFNIQRFFLGD